MKKWLNPKKTASTEDVIHGEPLGSSGGPTRPSLENHVCEPSFLPAPERELCYHEFLLCVALSCEILAVCADVLVT
jgi:hypothetical protein